MDGSPEKPNHLTSSLIYRTKEPEKATALLEDIPAAQCLVLERALGDDKQGLDRLFAEADKSIHTRKAWLLSLIQLQEWLEKRNRRPEKLEMLLGYLYCSSEGSPNVPSDHFPDEVRRFLREHGFTGSH